MPKAPATPIKTRRPEARTSPLSVVKVGISVDTIQVVPGYSEKVYNQTCFGNTVPRSASRGFPALRLQRKHPLGRIATEARGNIHLDSETDYLVFPCSFHFSAARTSTFLFAVFQPDRPEERPCRLVRIPEGEHWRV
jgi:hypothetical protein